LATEKLFRVFGLFILALAVSSCYSLSDGGSNTLVKESTNNVHSKKAILFLREAGATVANSYQVSIIDYKTKFDTVAIGNTFTADDNHGKANLNPGAVNFKWLSDDTVEISYNKNLRTYIQKRTMDGVAIIYKLQ
jgi:hypothetical protein